MANGTFYNLAHEAFVRTPPSETQKVVRNLLRFSGPCTVFDPTAGEGDLLAPFGAIAGAHLVGVELDRNRAKAAIQALPDAQIIISPIEGVKFDAPFCQILALNPPYFFQNGKRAEYTITKAASEHLVAGGVAVGVYPARSAWGADMVNFWAKNYQNIQVYRFPDGDPDTDEHAFQRFTQIVVIGQKRERPLSEPNKADVSRLRGFRYRKPDKPHESWWAGGTPPPELPTSPVDQPYFVPNGALPCTYTLLKADESQLLTALMEHGYHHDASWREDTTFTEDGMVAPSAMPMLGPAHIASEILTGMFDGELVLDRYVMSTFITTAHRQVEVDDEEREKGVVEIRQTMDHPIVGVLDITTGAVRYYVGADEAFSFITPLLPQLTPLVLKRRRPRYLPDEVRDWELETIMTIGVDKTLPGATHPGLAVQQMHRTLAMWRLLNGHA
jgi:predicted RNA methylase